jgi:hypothetical protein
VMRGMQLHKDLQSMCGVAGLDVHFYIPCHASQASSSVVRCGVELLSAVWKQH